MKLKATGYLVLVCLGIALIPELFAYLHPGIAALCTVIVWFALGHLFGTLFLGDKK